MRQLRIRTDSSLRARTLNLNAYPVEEDVTVAPEGPQHHELNMKIKDEKPGLPLLLYAEWHTLELDRFFCDNLQGWLCNK